jgi:hypothetical protein
MRIKYTQLEADAYMMDIDFVQFTLAVRACISALTSNDSKCIVEQWMFSRICSCDSVEKVEKVSKKFQIHKGIIRQIRISVELCKAKKLLQAELRVGLRTVKKRQHSTSTAKSTVKADEMKGNIKI